MTRKVTSARIALRKINVPTNSCEMAAACGDAGARVNALAVYGPGIATPTTGGAQDTPCTPHAKCRLGRAKRILWMRHIASNISLEDREGHASILDFASTWLAQCEYRAEPTVFLVNGR